MQSLLEELQVCTQRTCKTLDKEAEMEWASRALAAMRMQIESVTKVKHLGCLNDKMCRRFADHFPEELPPVEELPTNVYHCFKLWDPNKLIAQWQYSCPRKYSEAWSVLLHQHLEVGHIQLCYVTRFRCLVFNNYGVLLVLCTSLDQIGTAALYWWLRQVESVFLSSVIMHRIQEDTIERERDRSRVYWS